ncbi:30S ribosomal protein S6 [Elusimicrobiota bacterium]
MHVYETVFAVSATLGEDERQQSIKSVEETISTLGGAISTSEEMGEKKLAYKVDGHDRAYYHVIKFSCPPSAIDELKKHYRIHSSYLRNIVVSEQISV